MKNSLTLPTGEKFKWSDDDPRPWSDERNLLEILDGLNKHHKWTTYFGEDPYKDWNGFIGELKSKVIEKLRATKGE